MIMPRGQPLLLPVNPVFIVASLLVGLAINVLPLGRVVWTPDILMLLLAFWVVHQSSWLGQHALAYTVMSFGAMAMHRRLLWFSVPSQALQVFPLFVLAHAVELFLRMVGGGVFPGFWGLLAPMLEALLWPLASWVLLAPQRRPPDRDQNRPL